jgi:membrane-bound inhibitor of C-type lysozyme
MTILRFVWWVVGFVVLTAAGASVWLAFTTSKTETPVVVIPSATTTPPRVVAQAQYMCDGERTMKAVFMESAQPTTTSAVPDVPPQPTGQVSLMLDTAPAVVLAQGISADGARYGTNDESLVFWSKGAAALVLQDGQEGMYTNCIVVKDNPGGLSQIYHDGTIGFTVRYQTDFGTNATYTYSGLGPKKEIAGIKFIIPASMATGTNLSADSYVSVEHLSTTTAACDADAFLLSGTHATAITENDVTYSFASSSDAGAGNRYEESVYAFPGSQPCLAVRTFVHYMAIENYATGTVRAFDRESLDKTFALIRDSLTFVPRYAEVQ